jgi:hypothetical protein
MMQSLKQTGARNARLTDQMLDELQPAKTTPQQEYGLFVA